MCIIYREDRIGPGTGRSGGVWLQFYILFNVYVSGVCLYCQCSTQLESSQLKRVRRACSVWLEVKRLENGFCLHGSFHALIWHCMLQADNEVKDCLISIKLPFSLAAQVQRNYSGTDCMRVVLYRDRFLYTFSPPQGSTQWWRLAEPFVYDKFCTNVFSMNMTASGRGSE